MQLVNVHHYKPADVVAILKQARQVVDDADLPDELRVLAFEKAVDLVALHSVIQPQQTAVSLPMMAIPGKRQ
jgi:hypothetical protein